MMNTGNVSTIWSGDHTSGGWAGSGQPIWTDHTKTIISNETIWTDHTNTITGNETIWTISQNALSEDELQFFELVLAALGVNIKYDDFKNMDKSQRKNLLREVKINIITK